MRMYKVIVCGRTFNTFQSKQSAIECARNCLDLGYRDIYVAYGNWNPVPKTPAYGETERRVLGEPREIVILWRPTSEEARRFHADTITVVADKNQIDHEFYREFWLNGELIARYPSRTFDFDM